MKSIFEIHSELKNNERLSHDETVNIMGGFWRRRSPRTKFEDVDATPTPIYFSVYIHDGEPATEDDKRRQRPGGGTTTTSPSSLNSF